MKKSEAHTVIAIGDLHGDIGIMKRIMIDLSIISEDWNWIATSATVIILGDVLDPRRPGIASTHESDVEFHILNRLRDLKRQAGGSLVLLMGNHELMNLSSNDALTDYIFENQQRSRYSFRHDTEYGSFIQKEFSLLYSHRGFLFMHGGISANTDPALILNSGENAQARLSYLQRDFRSRIAKKQFNHPWIWSRDCAIDGRCPMNLNLILKMLGVSHLVVGHTIQPHITTRCEGSVICIDTALSKAFGDKPRRKEILIITEDRPYAFDIDTHTRRLLEVASL